MDAVILNSIPKEKLLTFSGEHLYYEIAMLYGVSDNLLQKPQDIYVYNALLESFVIHASIILDFFYKVSMKPDDARAEHYVVDVKKWRKVLPPLSSNLKNFNRKRNKEVVHLSYKRLEVRPEEKRWGSPTIARQLKKLINLFLDYADPQLLHPKLYEVRTNNKGRVIGQVQL